MGSWAEEQARAKEHADTVAAGGNFVRMKDDGDKVRVVIVGEPEVRKVFWDGQTYQRWTPESSAKPSLRWLLNAYNIDERKMQIIECNPQLFQAFVAVREKFPFADWILEVKRHGKARDPKTTYSVLPDKQLNEQGKAAIAKVDTHDLTQFSGGVTRIASSGNGSSAEEHAARAKAQAAEFSDDDLGF
jgi:hypothetical protein